MLMFSVVAFGAAAQLKVGSAPTVIDANANLEVESTNGKKFTIGKADGQVNTTGNVEVKGSSLSVIPASGTSQFLVSPDGSLQIKEAGLLVAPSAESSFSVNQTVGAEVKGQSFSVIPNTSQGQTKFSVNTASKVTIADGTQSDNAVLTSDASGMATWKPLPTLQKFVTVKSTEQQHPILYQFNPTLTGADARPLHMEMKFTPQAATDDFILDGIVHYNIDNVGGERIGLAVAVYLDDQPVGEEFIRNNILPGCYGDYINVKYIVDPLAYQGRIGQERTISLYLKPKRNDNNQIINGSPRITYVGIGTASSPGCGGSANRKNNRIILTSYQ